MPRIDDILASVIKGAQQAGASVEQLTIGREEKLANHAGLGQAVGDLAGMGMNATGGNPIAALLPGAIGAGLGADEGRGLQAAGGGLLGGLGGALGGGALGALAGKALGNPALGGRIGGTVGGIAGGALGAQHFGKEEGLLSKIRGKFSSAEDAYLAGSAHAAAQYKVAFGPLLGMGMSMLAPAAARMGLGRVAGGALGKMGGGMVGRAATGALNFAKKPIGGAVFDTGASMAAQSAMS